MIKWNKATQSPTPNNPHSLKCRIAELSVVAGILQYLAAIIKTQPSTQPPDSP